MEQLKIQPSVDGRTMPTKTTSEILIVKTANDWMEEARHLPDDVKLYDELWCEGESCFLFGAPGSGKSLMAVQIGVHIADIQPVLYCDFELNIRQFRKRYKIRDGIDFLFPEKFYRAEFAKDIEFESNSLIESIDANAKIIGAKIIIIDNISWIIENSEKGDVAGTFMKKLSHLKRNFGYSILTIAHTPKRDDTNPITIYDMAGSMRLQNFIDSSFAIVESARDEGLRYIKQTKCRSEEKAYGFESVLLMQLEQNEKGLLYFKQSGTAVETEHLKRPTETERMTKKEECLKLLSEGKTYSEIRGLTGLSKSVISKYNNQNKIDTEEATKLLPF